MNVSDLQRKLSTWAEQDEERKFHGLYKLITDVDWINTAYAHVKRVCFFGNDTINSRFLVPITALFDQSVFPPATSFKGARAEGFSANLAW